MTYPPQGQPGYPPQAPGYPPQYAPQAPPQYAPPQAQGYYPPQAPPQAQGYYPPQAAPAPEPVLARGTLEDYLDQPTFGGGVSVTKFFGARAQGSMLQLQVSRDLMNSDVRQQTDNNGKPITYKDGKPKFILIVPVNVLWSSDGSHPTVFPEGAGSLWLKGITSDAFKAAMAAAGVANPGKALASGKLGGAVFTMASAGEKQNPNPMYSATKLYNFQYTPGGRENEAPDPTAAVATPSSTPPASAPVSPPQYTPAPPPVTQMAPAPPAAPTVSAPPVAPAPVYPPQGYAPPQAPPAPPQAPPAPPQAPPAPPQAPPVDAEKAALLARLQGGGA